VKSHTNDLHSLFELQLRVHLHITFIKENGKKLKCKTVGQMHRQ